jgi:hypothetical protein
VEVKSAKHWYYAFVVPRNHAQGTIKIVQCTTKLRLKFIACDAADCLKSVRLAR